jgi:hypothetical protein
MNGKCFEIGTIQAFLDGETTPDVTLRLTDHVASCDSCARALAAADEENSIVFSTLERELNTLVPTQRLWNRINETIAVEHSRMSFWQKLAAFITTNLANPSIAVAAGILLVFGMFATVINFRTSEGPAVVSAPTDSQVSPSSPTETVTIATTGGDPSIPAAGVKPSVDISNYSDKEIRAIAVNANVKSGQRAITPQRTVYNPDAYLPGEESYVKTISDLKQNVDEQKDDVLTPSTRVSYERDMAVVNDSIKRMREVVKKNPRNQAARQVLYSSYQDKIDLLNSVAQREELIASLK